MFSETRTSTAARSFFSSSIPYVHPVLFTTGNLVSRSVGAAECEEAVIYVILVYSQAGVCACEQSIMMSHARARTDTSILQLADGRKRQPLALWLVCIMPLSSLCRY